MDTIYGTPVFAEEIVLAATQVCSQLTYPKGEPILISSFADSVIHLGEEFIHGSCFGDEAGYQADWIFGSDVEDAEFDTDDVIVVETTNAPTLNFSRKGRVGNRNLEFKQDDQDDEVWFRVKSGEPFSTAKGSIVSGSLPTVRSFQFSIGHIDSDNTKVMQFAVIRQGQGAAVVPEYYTASGNTWAATEVWNDITGSATYAHYFTDVTLDTQDDSVYKLGLRSKADYAAEISNIEFVSLIAGPPHATDMFGQVMGPVYVEAKKNIAITPNADVRIIAEAGGASGMTISYLRKGI